MSNIQFKSGAMLFQGGAVSFCPGHCTCTDPGGPAPPDPKKNTCGACKSPVACAYLPACTPRRVQLILTDPTFAVVCVPCGDAGSVTVSSGTIAGTKVLEQDPTNACRWVLVDNSPTLTVTGYSAVACGGSPTVASQVEYQLVQTGTGFYVSVVARFASLKGAEFIVFLQSGIGLFDMSKPVTLSGGTYFSPECGSYQERIGGVLHYGGTGTVTLSVCPDLPTICHCTDSPTCVGVRPIVLPPGLPDFTYDETATRDKVACPRTNVCEWISAVSSAAGVSNLMVKVKWYDTSDTHAEKGCGYYLYLYAFDGVDPLLKGVYYHYGEDASGIYELYDAQELSGLPATLEVVFDCTFDDAVPTTCPTLLEDSTFTLTLGEEWKECTVPPSPTLSGPLWEGILYNGETGVVPDCEWVNAPDPAGTTWRLPNDQQFGLSSVSIQSDIDGYYWMLDVWESTTVMWRGKKRFGLYPYGIYTADPGFNPAFIRVTRT